MLSNKSKRCLAAVAILSATLLSIQPVANAKSSYQKAATHLDSLVIKNKNFSGAIGIYSASNNDFERHFALGFANKEKATPFSTDTVTDMGSLTKQFTGAAIVRLVSQNKLSAQDKLGQHLSGLKPHLANVTLHQLLTHSAGITEETGDDYASFTLQDLLQQLNQQPLAYKVGTHHYSNLGYSLLTAVIEKVSGLSYEQFLRKEFFQPLGMSHTGYQLPGFTDNEVAFGYEDTDNWGQSHNKNWAKDGPYWNLRGNGGILSTVSDMAKWVKALHGEQVFSTKEKALLFGHHVQEHPKLQSFYGYGWVGEDINNKGNKIIWHNGSNGIFTAEVRYYPQDDLFFIVVSNQAETPTWNVAEPLHQVISANN